ncbi:MAG: DivIVA domain-containing protein [Thermodesulfobacteriota bacterium]|jgi:cell division initiation protein|nr:MAG: DivIVA domain-containing protein [Thermodesulfobacteriota bacterium]
MKLTPLDIQQQQFSVRFRGFDTNEVDTFLETVASELEDLLKKNKELLEELERKEARIGEYQNMEKTLKETLLMAHATSEEMKKNAQKAVEELKATTQKEAAFVLARAREQAEKMIAETNSRLIKIQEEVNELKRKKIILKQELRFVLETHLRLLESSSEKEVREPDEKPPSDT